MSYLPPQQNNLPPHPQSMQQYPPQQFPQRQPPYNPQQPQYSPHMPVPPHLLQQPMQHTPQTHQPHPHQHQLPPPTQQHPQQHTQQQQQHHPQHPPQLHQPAPPQQPVHSQPPAVAPPPAIAHSHVLSPTVLKSLDRQATIAFCPLSTHNNLLAVATHSGTIDDSFETRSLLEIYDTQLHSAELKPKQLGAVSAKETFHTITWGPKSYESVTHGIIAGGMSDGAINLYSASAILGASPSGGAAAATAALIARTDVHKGIVNSLAFHPTQANLLASGGSDGEVYIWDLATPAQPRPTKPNPQQRAASNGITVIGWNVKVPSILASSSDTGETTVWDLRKKSSIIVFRNSSARTPVRTSDLVWNPESPFQLSVAYANHPVIEVWDLRQTMSPKLKLEGFHSNSVLSLDWCPLDSQLLLSSGDDGRIGLWDVLTGISTGTGQLLTELPPTTTQQSMNYEVHWSPHSPIYAACTNDGHVTINSIAQTGSHVPSWAKHRAGGVQFGFGGRIVTHTVPPTPAGATQPPAQQTVSISTVPTDPLVIQLSQSLQQLLMSGDYINFCSNKVNEYQHALTQMNNNINTHANGSTITNDIDNERLVWTFMRILFENESTQKYSLLKELGFDAPAGTAASTTGASTEVTGVYENAINKAAEVNDESFFDQDFSHGNGDGTGLADGLPEEKNGTGISTPNKVRSSSTSSHTSGVGNSVELMSSAVKRALSKGLNKDVYTSLHHDDDDEQVIRSALLYGQFGVAAQKCLETGRLADAIMFAMRDEAVWPTILAHYFDRHPHPFIRTVVRAVIGGTYNELATTAGLIPTATDSNSWQQTLATLLAFTNGDVYRQCVNILAGRLEQARMNYPALICYMCNANVDKAIELFNVTSATATTVSATLSGHSEMTDPVYHLHNVMQKVCIFAAATQAQTLNPPSRALSETYATYASMLASNGVLSYAWSYLAQTTLDENSAALLDRIFHASQATDQPIQAPLPQFPFLTDNVAIDPQLNAIIAAHDATRRQKEAIVAATVQHPQQQAAAPQQPTAATPHQLNGQPYGSYPTPASPYPAAPNATPLQRNTNFTPPTPYPAQTPAPQYGQTANANAYPSYGTPQQNKPPMPPPTMNQNPPAMPTPPSARNLPPPTYGQQASQQAAPAYPMQQTSQPPPPTAWQPQQQTNQGGLPPPPRGAAPTAASSLPPPAQSSPYAPAAQYNQQQQQQQQQQRPQIPYGQVPPPQLQAPQTQYSAPPPSGPTRPAMPQQMGIQPPPQQHQYQQPQPMNPPPQQFPSATPPPPQPQMQQQLPHQHPPPPQQQQQLPPQAQPQLFAPTQPSYAQPPQQHQPPLQAPIQPNPQQQQRQFVPPQQPQTPVQPMQPQQPTLQTPLRPNTLPSPAAPQAVAPPPAAAGPIGTADPTLIMNTLNTAINTLLASNLPPPEARKVTEMQQRIALIPQKIAANTITSAALIELTNLAQCMARSDYTSAQKIHLELVRTAWAGNSEWLLGLKTIIIMAKKYLGGQ